MSLIELAKVWPFDALVKGFSQALTFLVVLCGHPEQAVVASVGVLFDGPNFQIFPNVHGQVQSEHKHGNDGEG